MKVGGYILGEFGNLIAGDSRSRYKPHPQLIVSPGDVCLVSLLFEIFIVKNNKQFLSFSLIGRFCDRIGKMWLQTGNVSFLS